MKKSKDRCVEFGNKIITFGETYSHTTAEGKIDEIGQNKIKTYLESCGVDMTNKEDIKALQLEKWNAKGKGKWVGLLYKRLRKFVYHHGREKANEEELAALIELVRSRVSAGVTYHFDFTDRLNWYAGDFGDHGSCFWNGRERARDMIAEVGGFAVRFFDSKQAVRGRGTGRAFIIPSFARGVDPIFTLINGYGKYNINNSTLAVTKILGDWSSLHYKKVDVANFSNTVGTLWINGGGAYSFGPLDYLRGVFYVDLMIPDQGYSHMECSISRKVSNIGDLVFFPGIKVRHNILETETTPCPRCGFPLLNKNSKYMKETHRRSRLIGEKDWKGVRYCSFCVDTFLVHPTNLKEKVLVGKNLCSSERIDKKQYTYTVKSKYKDRILKRVGAK